MGSTLTRGAFCHLIFLFSIATYSLAQTPGVPESPAPLRELFIDMDANNDQVVEAAEVPESGQQAFRTLLKYGDANHDGKLEAGEYRELLMKVNWGQVVPPEQLERRFHNLDKNQDGKLDAKEFQGGAPQVRPARPQSRRVPEPGRDPLAEGGEDRSPGGGHDPGEGKGDFAADARAPEGHGQGWRRPGQPRGVHGPARHVRPTGREPRRLPRSVRSERCKVRARTLGRAPENE